MLMEESKSMPLGIYQLREKLFPITTQLLLTEGKTGKVEKVCFIESKDRNCTHSPEVKQSNRDVV